MIGVLDRVSCWTSFRPQIPQWRSAICSSPPPKSTVGTTLVSSSHITQQSPCQKPQGHPQNRQVLKIEQLKIKTAHEARSNGDPSLVSHRLPRGLRVGIEGSTGATANYCG